MYCKKIQLDLRSANFDRLKGNYIETFGLSYHNYEIKDKDYLNDLIKDQIQFIIPPDHVYWTEITEEGLGCHIDNSSVALNYCVQSPKSMTYFFTQKVTSTPKMVVNTIEGINHSSRTYEWAEDQLEMVLNISINPHEAYLLNTHQIHCVKKTEQTVRSHLRWVWRDVPYKIIEPSIIQKNELLSKNKS